jgi:hypothetical protein
MTSEIGALKFTPVHYIISYNNFDREGPRGADLYILWSVATRCI